MNRLHIVAVGLAACCLTGQSRSEENPKGDGSGGQFFERMLKEFDKDGDGKLNEEERATAQRMIEQFLGRLKERGDTTERRPNSAEGLKRFDKDGDGKLNDEEKAASKKGRDGQMKKRPLGGFDLNNPPEFVVKRFDKDGDGKLNDDEKIAAREAMAKMAGGPGGLPNREEMIKRFDKDGDGKLSDTEQAVARAEMEKRRGGGGAAGGLTPGEGKPQEPKLDNDELLKKFDKDGDGKLSDEEKAAVRAAFQKRDKEK